MRFLKVISLLEPLGIDIGMWILAKCFQKAVPTLTKIFMEHPYNQIRLPQDGKAQRSLRCKKKKGRKDMKKISPRQMILSMIGGALCSVSVMGCYPLVPAYFAALYLEEVNTVLLLGMMYIGMLVFMPITAVVKYVVALLVIWGAIRLIEWANEGCPSYMAGGMAAISTVILSFGGGLLDWKDQPQMLVMILEGVFIFGAVILLNRFLHIAANWSVEKPVAERADGGKEERLRGYAESFQGLSQIFHTMSAKRSSYTTDELGQIQNELTGKMCASCDSCALCWERDSTPLYN